MFSRHRPVLRADGFHPSHAAQGRDPAGCSRISSAPTRLSSTAIFTCTVDEKNGRITASFIAELH